MMDEYITRNNAISAVCFGCNQEFSDEPCEPDACAIRKSIMTLPTADVVPKSEFDNIPVEVAQVLQEKAVEKAKAEAAREIFEEIGELVSDFSAGCIDTDEFLGRFYAIREKRTEEKT